MLPQLQQLMLMQKKIAIINNLINKTRLLSSTRRVFNNGLKNITQTLINNNPSNQIIDKKNSVRRKKGIIIKMIILKIP